MTFLLYLFYVSLLGFSSGASFGLFFSLPLSSSFNLSFFNASIASSSALLSVLILATSSSFIGLCAFTTCFMAVARPTMAGVITSPIPPVSGPTIAVVANPVGDVRDFITPDLNSLEKSSKSFLITLPFSSFFSFGCARPQAYACLRFLFSSFLFTVSTLSSLFVFLYFSLKLSSSKDDTGCEFFPSSSYSFLNVSSLKGCIPTYFFLASLSFSSYAFSHFSFSFGRLMSISAFALPL